MFSISELVEITRASGLLVGTNIALAGSKGCYHQETNFTTNLREHGGYYFLAPVCCLDKVNINIIFVVTGS